MVMAWSENRKRGEQNSRQIEEKNKLVVDFEDSHMTLPSGSLMWLHVFVCVYGQPSQQAI
eukprot:m.203136 g.203136  ORF g.203136 m.203136 type:complete len:60 (+) comp25997_c0_seq1:39-218(+)